MVCKIPKDGLCYFEGLMEYQEGSKQMSTADLNGANVCLDMHVNYRPGQIKEGGLIPFTVSGLITPQLMNADTYPPFIPFNVTGTRVYGVKTFYASGTIGKYPVKNIRIDCNARPGPDIVDIKVGLPCKALLTNKNAK